MRLPTTLLLGLMSGAVACTPSQARHTATPTSATPMPATGADSARCANLPPVGSTLDTIAGKVSFDAGQALPPSWAAMLLEGFREHLRLPTPLLVPARGGARRHGQDTVTLAVHGQVLATLRRSGAIENPDLSVTTLSRELDERLVEAVRSLDSAHVVPPFPPEIKADSVRVRFSVGGRVDTTAYTKALFVAQEPTWILERPVRARHGNPAPVYPAVAEQARVGDTVLVSFVVDATGSTRPETAQVLRGHYSDFEIAVLELLPHLRFYPARIDGCPVMQLVQMPFMFRMPR